MFWPRGLPEKVSETPGCPPAHTLRTAVRMTSPISHKRLPPCRQYTRMSSFSLLQCQFSTVQRVTPSAYMPLNLSTLKRSFFHLPPPPAKAPFFTFPWQQNSLYGRSRGRRRPAILHMNKKWNQRLVINQSFLELKRKINPGTWHS